MQKNGSIKKLNLDGMTVDELWQLHEELSGILSTRLISEKRELEKRLAQLRRDERGSLPLSLDSDNIKEGRPRRAYPRVLPKYRNPDDPSETWSGRGKQPRWVSAALKSGLHMDDFLIPDTAKAVRDRR